MRLEEWHRWLDTQYLDAPSAPSESAEAPASPAVAFAPPPSVAMSSSAPPVSSAEPTVPARPVPANTPPPSTMAPPSVVGPSGLVEEVELPQLDRYLPFLRASRLEAEPVPSPGVIELPSAVVESQPEPELIVDSRPIEVEEATRGQADTVGESLELAAEAATFVPQEPGPEPRRSSVFGSPRTARTPRAAARPASRMPSPAPSVEPLEPDALWKLTPRSVQFRMALGDELVQREPQGRQKSETRLDFIQRLLNPAHSLEETAALTRCRPAVVRMPPRRDCLHYQRQTGEPVSNRLPEALAFVEALSREPLRENRHPPAQ